MLRSELAKKNFGILFLVCQKDKYGYNNTLNGFYTKEDYNGNELITDTSKFTTDNKDAAPVSYTHLNHHLHLIFKMFMITLQIILI